MADWKRPDTLSTEELKRFLLDQTLRDRIRRGYNDGFGIVNDVFFEIACRLDGNCGEREGNRSA